MVIVTSRIFKLKVNVPFMKKGSVFRLHDQTGAVTWFDEGKEIEYSLRPGLAQYLWLLSTEPKYMELIEYDDSL